MKNKLITSFFIILIIIFITTIVQATDIQITLPKDLKQTNLQNQSNISLYAINEQKDESVTVVQQQNELTQKVINLNQLDKEAFNTFLAKYNEAKKQEGQKVLKQEIYQKNEVVFINTIFEYTDSNNNKIQIEEYYTIVNKNAIMISASFLNKEVDSIKVRGIIDSISISNEIKRDLEFLVIPIVLIVLVISYVFKQRKNKIQLDENEKKKVLQKVVEYMRKIDYSKFTGILIVFTVTVLLNILNLFLGIVDVIHGNNWISYSIESKIYFILGILQNAVQLIGIIYIGYRLTKKEEKTIKNIKNTFIIMIIAIILLTIARVITQAIYIGIGLELMQFLTKEIQVFTKSMVYILIWYFYFKNSIRVSVYFKEKKLEQIVNEPKKGYQASQINKKIAELKIIEYFKINKALDYVSGIYINKLPKEYANSLALSDLNTKKIIRLKRAKYYLSEKELENAKSERRKTIKTVISISIIYLFVLLILYLL